MPHGAAPFQGTNPTDILLAVLADDPVPPRQLNPEVPRDVETITLKCLRKDPAKRLHRFLQGEPIRARPASLRERPWRRRRRIGAVGLVLFVVAILGFGGHALLGWQRVRRDRAFDKAFARGVKQAEANQFKEAIGSFNEALRLRPDSSLAWTTRGKADHNLEDYDRALADHAEAIRLDPDNALAHRGRGWTYLSLRRWGEVREYARRNPKLGNRFFTEGAAALAAGDEPGARQARDRLLALAEVVPGERTTSAAACLCALAEKAEIESARRLSLVEKGMKGHEKDLFVQRGSVLVGLRVGRAKEALRQIEGLLQGPSKQSPGIDHLLHCLALPQAGREGDARRALDEAVRAGAAAASVSDALLYHLLLREARMDVGK